MNKSKKSLVEAGFKSLRAKHSPANKVARIQSQTRTKGVPGRVIPPVTTSPH